MSKVQADYLGASQFPVEIALEGFPDVLADLLDGLPLRVDAVPNSTGGIPANPFILVNLKDDLRRKQRHGPQPTPEAFSLQPYSSARQ